MSAAPPTQRPRRDSAPPTGAPFSVVSFFRNFLAASGPWSLSAFTHLLVVVGLGLCTLASPDARQVVLDVFSTPSTMNEDAIQDMSLELASHESVDVASDSQDAFGAAGGTVGGTGGSGGGAGASPMVELASSVGARYSEVGDMGGPKIGDIGGAMTPGQVGRRLGGSIKGQPARVVDNYDEAFDAITNEIVDMLEDKKVLLVWAFDQSESMQDDIQEIRGRIKRVYDELGFAGSARGESLWTSVVSYGSDFRVLTDKPTSDISLIEEAMNKVPVDPTGKEYMCGAVGQTIDRYKRFASTRQLAMVLVTDESGEQGDKEYLEQVINEAKKCNMRIYILGRESVFGYPYARIRWNDPKTAIEYWIQIDRGPETPFVEQLQTDGFHARWDAHPSGFGPYEQCRMAVETSGIFFLLPSLETNLVRGEKRRYELELMKPYLPDLGPRDQALAQQAASPLKTVLWKVIHDLNPHDPKAGKYVNMRIHFSVDPVQRAREIQEELVKAETLVRYFRAAEDELENHKNERRREESPRWQANYDLIYAQTVCYQVRLYEYGAYLDKFLKEPKKVTNPRGSTKPTTHWTIGLAKETLTGDKTKDYVDRATQLFQKIIEQHPGTPWAARADYELRHGYGVHLWEDYIDPRHGKDVTLPNL